VHAQEPLEGYVRTEVDLGQSGSVVHCRRQLPEQGEHNGNFGSLDALQSPSEKPSSTRRA